MPFTVGRDGEVVHGAGGTANGMKTAAQALRAGGLCKFISVLNQPCMLLASRLSRLARPLGSSVFNASYANMADEKEAKANV